MTQKPKKRPMRRLVAYFLRPEFCWPVIKKSHNPARRNGDRVRPVRTKALSWPKTRRCYTSHTYALNLARKPGPKPRGGSGKIGRNDIDIFVGEEPWPGPSDRGGRLRPNRSKVGPVGVSKRKTVIWDGGADGVDQQLPDSDGRGLQIDNIGSFQIDWRDIDARAEMMESGAPIGTPTAGHPYPPSPLWRNEVPHE